LEGSAVHKKTFVTRPKRSPQTQAEGVKVPLK